MSPLQQTGWEVQELPEPVPPTVIGEHVNPTWVPAGGKGSPRNPKSSPMIWVSDCSRNGVSVLFRSTSIERKNAHRLSAVAALDAAGVTRAAATAANFERGGNSTGNASKGNDGEQNSGCANEHVGVESMRELVFTDD